MAPKPGALPPELEAAIVNANVENRGRENETTPADQRIATRVADVEMSSGPRRGLKDEYLPATYPTNGTIRLPDGSTRPSGTIRTDR